MVMENRKKKGRPSKGENKLTVSINLKLTQKEYNSVKGKSDILGLDLVILAGKIKELVDDR